MYFDDLDDLIIRDLLNEGYSQEDLIEKIPERKKELESAFLKMAKEAEEQIAKGEYVTLEQLKKELEDDEG